VIHSGGADIVHDDKRLDLLSPGDTFGHAAMLSPLTRDHLRDVFRAVTSVQRSLPK
jgi:hypothetical protein